MNDSSKVITDPQTQGAYHSADPNNNTVDSASVGGDADNTRILARQTPSGTSRGVQQLGGPSLQADSGNKQITVTDTVPQVLMGSQPTFGEGFFVSKPGIDVTSATSASSLVFNSNQNVFKIIEGYPKTISLTFVNAAVDVISIAHGLDFVPAAIAFLNGVNQTSAGGDQLLSNANIPLPTFLGTSVDTIKGTATNSGNSIPIVAFSAYLFVAPDPTYINFEMLNASGGSIFTRITYYLLTETATT